MGYLIFEVLHQQDGAIFKQHRWLYTTAMIVPKLLKHRNAILYSVKRKLTT